MNVLNLDYRTVSNLILTGPRTMVMEVMEEADYWRQPLFSVSVLLSLFYLSWTFFSESTFCLMECSEKGTLDSVHHFDSKHKHDTNPCFEIHASRWLLIDCYWSMSAKAVTGRIKWEKRLPNIILSRTVAFKTLLVGLQNQCQTNICVPFRWEHNSVLFFRLFHHLEFSLWVLEIKGIQHCIRYFMTLVCLK